MHKMILYATNELRVIVPFQGDELEMSIYKILTQYTIIRTGTVTRKDVVPTLEEGKHSGSRQEKQKRQQKTR